MATADVSFASPVDWAATVGALGGSADAVLARGADRRWRPCADAPWPAAYHRVRDAPPGDWVELPQPGDLVVVGTRVHRHAGVFTDSAAVARLRLDQAPVGGLCFAVSGGAILLRADRLPDDCAAVYRPADGSPDVRFALPALRAAGAFLPGDLVPLPGAGALRVLAAAPVALGLADALDDLPPGALLVQRPLLGCLLLRVAPTGGGRARRLLNMVVGLAGLPGAKRARRGT